MTWVAATINEEFIRSWRTRQKKQIVDAIVNHAYLSESLSPKTIVLFGSFASGTWNDRSDVDLLYVWNTSVRRKKFWEHRPSIEAWLSNAGLHRRVDLLEDIESISGQRLLAAVQAMGPFEILLDRGSRSSPMMLLSGTTTLVPFESEKRSGTVTGRAGTCFVQAPANRQGTGSDKPRASRRTEPATDTG